MSKYATPVKAWQIVPCFPSLPGDCGCQDSLNSRDTSTSSAKGRLMCPSAFSMTSPCNWPQMRRPSSLMRTAGVVTDKASRKRLKASTAAVSSALPLPASGKRRDEH